MLLREMIGTFHENYVKHKCRLCDKTHSLLVLKLFVPTRDFKFCTCYNACKTKYFEIITEITQLDILKTIKFPPGFVCSIISSVSASSIL
jgi:hypothetical protein